MTEHQRFTPYRSIEDVFTLRDRFFRAEYDPIVLEECIRTVHLWHTKAPVPHGINMTALIISIQLNDPKYNPKASAARSSLYALRSAYAEFVITLVNGFLDPFHGEVAFPISILASQIGLPNFLVEFRHAATHDILPSLETLRFIGEKALVWLEGHFWTQENLSQTPSVAIEAFAGRVPSIVSKPKCLALIKLYRNNQKRGIENASALSQLKALSQDSRQFGVLGKLLLNSKVLLSNSGTFAKLKTFYLPLLDVLSDAFILHLLFGVVSRCFKTQGTQNRPTLHAWLAYFINRLPNLIYPVASLHTFETPQEVKDYLRKYLGILHPESSDCMRETLDGKAHRTFSAAPSLEAILKGSSSEPASEAESTYSLPAQEVSPSDSLKRRKLEEPFIFSTFSAWKPVPFGVYPES